MPDSTTIVSLLGVPGAFDGLPDVCPGADKPPTAAVKGIKDMPSPVADAAAAEEKRVALAAKLVGAENVLMERPPFVIVKQRVNSATGETEERESIHCPMLAQAVRDKANFRFVHFPGSNAVMTYWYSGGVYGRITDAEFKAHIKREINRWNPNLVRMRDVQEAFSNLSTDLCFYDESDKNPDELLINFRNGLYDMETETMKPHSPDIFTTRQLPFDFPADHDKQTAWANIPNFKKFMRRLCYGPKHDHPDGDRRFNLLMQFIAVLVSNVNGGLFKKSLWMYGPGDSGKSQFLKLLVYLLGERNCYSCDLAKLESERFAAGPIYGKRLLLAPDLKFVKVPELSLFKKLTGNDPIDVERKGVDGFTYHFDGLCAFAMNRLPRFGGDDGKHVFDRMMIFECPEGVPEAEQDKTILDKMKAEAPYIVAFALSYLPGVIKRGYRFTELADAANIRKTYQLQNSSVGRFLSECCVDVNNPRDDAERAQVESWRGLFKKPTITAVYEVYKSWHMDYESGRPLSYSIWKDKLKEIFGVSTDKELSPKGNRGQIIPFFCLTEETASRYPRDNRD